MTLRLGSVVINCTDIDRMAAFWSAALGLTPRSERPPDDFCVLLGDGVNLSLQVTARPPASRDQMHFDLYTPDQNAEVERLQALGAKFVRHTVDFEDDYVVLADPEGNLLCVCLVKAAR